jgi:hypothetical protein
MSPQIHEKAEEVLKQRMQSSFFSATIRKSRSKSSLFALHFFFHAGLVANDLSLTNKFRSLLRNFAFSQV